MRIIFDGADGVGKSTLVESFCNLPIGDMDEGFEVAAFPTNLPEGGDKADNISRVLFHLQDFHHELKRKHRHKHLVFDRSFVTTLSYQGFLTGTKVDAGLYESIFLLGHRIFLDPPVHDVTTNPVIFCHVKCDPAVSVERINQRVSDRVDELEGQDPEWQLQELTTLRKRLDLVYADMERRLGGRYPVHFIELDTTELAEDTAFGQLQDLLKPFISPEQLSLFTSEE